MDKNELLTILDKMSDRLGCEQMLEALARVMSSDDLEDNLRYINRVYETNVF